MLLPNLKQYIGKYLLRDNGNYKWMFKVIDVIDRHKLLVTEALDIYPTPRAYKRGIRGFLEAAVEDIDSHKCGDDMRLPTKEDFNIYRESWRKIVFLRKL
jgi:hypothetical protein